MKWIFTIASSVVPRFNINWHYTLLINIHYCSIVVYLLPDYYCPSPRRAVTTNNELHRATQNTCHLLLRGGHRSFARSEWAFLLVIISMAAGTYPFWVNANGTSILCDGRLLSPAMSASWAKLVSLPWSANRADRRDSSNRTSSRRFFNSEGNCKGHKTNQIISGHNQNNNDNNNVS